MVIHVHTSYSIKPSAFETREVIDTVTRQE